MIRKFLFVGAAFAVVMSSMLPFVKAQEESNPLSQSNNALAFSLYHTVKEESGGNLIFSPYSIFHALGMLYAGARGTTQQQMAEALALPPESEVYFAQLYIDLNAPPEYEDILFQLNIANALWAQQGYPLHSDYVDLLSEFYGSSLQEVDFAAPEEAAQTINDAVSQQTNGRIQDLIDPSTLDPLSRLILTNAIYMNAAWSLMFDESETQDGSFTLLDGSQVTVPMMHLRNQFPFVGTEHYLALQLEFQHRNFGMLIILPDEGQFAAVEAMLSPEFFDAVQSQLFDPYNLILSLPRFRSETSLNLRDTLAQLGMPQVFSTDADFSGIADEPLFVSAVTHKAFISVDEKGTEAAAATAIGLGGGGPPNVPIEFNVNRPFIYIIYRQSFDELMQGNGGTILFIGRVLNPAE